MVASTTEMYSTNQEHAEPLLVSDDNPMPSQTLSVEEEDKVSEPTGTESLVEYASAPNDEPEREMDVEPIQKASELYEERIQRMQTEIEQYQATGSSLVNYS